MQQQDTRLSHYYPQLCCNNQCAHHHNCDLCEKEKTWCQRSQLVTDVLCPLAPLSSTWAALAGWTVPFHTSLVWLRMKVIKTNVNICTVPSVQTLIQSNIVSLRMVKQMRWTEKEKTDRQTETDRQMDRNRGKRQKVTVNRSQIF